MGWGTCYIESEGYLNRVRIDQIDEEIAEVEPRQIHGDWCDEKKCHVCDAPIVGSCKLPLVDKDYAWDEDGLMRFHGIRRRMRGWKLDRNVERCRDRTFVRRMCSGIKWESGMS